MARLRPYLMFQGQAAEALAAYRSLFADAEILSVESEDSTPKPTLLRLAGQEILVFDSPSVHDFGFTPSLSLYVDCEDAAEFERLVAGLADGGSFLMPADDYGFSRRFAWLNDRFGVSWQINLP